MVMQNWLSIPLETIGLGQSWKINGSMSQILPATCFILNKLLLEYNYAYSLICCLWLFSYYKAELWQRPNVLQSPKYLLFALLDKKFVDPWSRQHCPIEFSAMVEMFYIRTFLIGASSHIWPLRTWNVASPIEEINILFNFNSHMWLTATVLENVRIKKTGKMTALEPSKIYFLLYVSLKGSISECVGNSIPLW